MIKQVELVLARMEDLDEIFALCRDVAEKTPSSHWGEDYPTRGILAHDLQTQTLYKVTDGKKIVSIMSIRPWTVFMESEDADDIDGWDKSIHNPCALGRFCVSPACQHQGLGRRVMAASLEKAKEMGFDGAFFHMVKGNDIAQALYDSMGFECVGEVDEYGMGFLCFQMKL